MAGRFKGHYVGEILDTYQWRGEFHRTLRGAIRDTYQCLELQRTLRGGDSRHIPRAVSFTGHYVGEVLDTYQWLGVSLDTM
jgi:hypothetical protein